MGCREPDGRTIPVQIAKVTKDIQGIKMNIEEHGVTKLMKLRNKTNGIIGTFVKEFRATGVGMITVVRVPDGREYRAPSYEWEKFEY